MLTHLQTTLLPTAALPTTDVMKRLNYNIKNLEINILVPLLLKEPI